MPRKILKRWIPDHNKIRNYRSLKWMGSLIEDPNLFHLTRQSTSLAVMIGLFVACQPIFGQMPLAALLALLLRANMPISVMMVWVTNPVTFPIFLVLTYRIGAWMLNTPPMDIRIDPSFEWFRSEAIHIWKPLLLGSLLAGLISGFIGYMVIYWLWRWKVVRNWQKRASLRRRKLNLPTRDAE